MSIQNADEAYAIAQKVLEQNWTLEKVLDKVDKSARAGNFNVCCAGVFPELIKAELRKRGFQVELDYDNDSVVSWGSD